MKPFIQKWESFFLIASFVAFLLANALYFGWIGNSREAGIFVGHWVTSILVMLTYLRLSVHSTQSSLRQGGRDRNEEARPRMHSTGPESSPVRNEPRRVY